MALFRMLKNQRNGPWPLGLGSPKLLEELNFKSDLECEAAEVKKGVSYVGGQVKPVNSAGIFMAMKLLDSFDTPARRRFQAHSAWLLTWSK